MLARLALLAVALTLLQPALAAEPLPARDNLCRQALPTIRELWQRDLYDAPPGVAVVMVDAIDGKLPQVRQGLVALPAAEQAHWRQVAMLTAANAYQPAVVDGLLDDGAAVDEPVRLPPFNRAFYRQTANGMAHDPRFGPGVAKGLQSAGVMNNHGNLVGPALPLAVTCGDTATLDVLLRHHANVMVRAAPNVVDALTAAVVAGDAPIVSRLLDHGADVCAHDRRVLNPGYSLADIGRRQHLPDGLLRRLSCRETATVH